MATGSTRVRVGPAKGGGWEVREPGAPRALAKAPDREHAITEARVQLIRGGTIEILDDDGYITSTRQVRFRDSGPWWYVRPGPGSWILSSVFVLYGLVGSVDPDPTRFAWWWALLMGVCGVLRFVAAACSRRLDREDARLDH